MTTPTTITTTTDRVDAELIRELEAELSGRRESFPVHSAVARRWARRRLGSVVTAGR